MWYFLCHRLFYLFWMFMFQLYEAICLEKGPEIIDWGFSSDIALYNHRSIANPNVKVKSCFTLELGYWIQRAVLPYICCIPVSLYSCLFQNLLMHRRWKKFEMLKKTDSCIRERSLHDLLGSWLEMLIQTSSLQTLLSGVETGFPIASIA